MKIKTSDLIGPALNWVVASIEAPPKDRLHLFYGKPAIDRECLGRIDTLRCEFSTNWAQGGPIIEREHISFVNRKGDPCRAFKGTPAHYEFSVFAPEGQPLIAAMRCYVYSKLGDEVEVPDELCE